MFNEYEDKESPFKSIIVDIRNKLSKTGDKLIKTGLCYGEEMKSLESAEIKEKLITFKNELIRKNRIKKDFDDYNGIKNIRYLFNEEDIYNGINVLMY